MATHDVFDARNGLPPELIAELRAAQLVVLGLKDERTAVARIELYQDQDQDQRVRTVILPAVVHLTHGARLAGRGDVGRCGGGVGGLREGAHDAAFHRLPSRVTM